MGQACEVDATEALRRVPILRREAIVRACWEPDLWALDADAMLQWYRRSARAAGAEFRLHADVTALGARASGWRVVAGEHVEEVAVVVNTSAPTPPSACSQTKRFSSTRSSSDASLQTRTHPPAGT